MTMLAQSLPERSIQEREIVIAASFTAEPIEQALSFWMSQLGIPARLRFAPYNQVFQQLLDPASSFLSHQHAANVSLVRLEDWLRLDGDSETFTAWGERQDKIRQNAQDLVRAFKSSAERSPTPHLVCLCPASAALADPAHRRFFQEMEDTIASDLDQISGVYPVTSAALTAVYGTPDYYDAAGDKLGHIPYTELFYTALATMVARKIYAILGTPYKVIALDCDNTLWQGVCAEDGPLGIGLDASHQALQDLMVAQHEAGMLLCLCSKNEEADVWDVFERRAEMRLKREQIVSWRINWQPKSENIESLAQELGLGLDSFILLDDNPLECAEVQANCPEVLTLQLPSESSLIPRFLAHTWAFDRLKLTQEDKRRTSMYRQNVQRERFRQEALSLADFLDGLELRVQISDMAPQHLARVAQLTQRTNQFNTTGRRRAESEIQQVLQSPTAGCLVVHVADRFGDYGLVGVVIFERGGQAIQVDSFLLSCRVLGRGVEHQVLARLGEMALANGLERVDVSYRVTQRNRPALDFLESVGEGFKSAQAENFQFPAQRLAKLVYVPGETEAGPLGEPAAGEPAAGEPAADREAGRSKPPAQAPRARAGDKAALLAKIATELATPEQVLERVKAQPRMARPHSAGAYAAPQSALERMLAELWQELLGVEQVGIHDDFFELGGDSIKAAIMVNRLQERLGEVVYVVAVFDAPTVAALAAYLGQQYPQAVARFLGLATSRAGPARIKRIDPERLNQFRQLIPPPTRLDETEPPNPPAIFILAPPRSGSTLLRVILGGHPKLFAPPELELLSFNTLAERQAALSGRYSFFLEGALRTIVQAQDCHVEQAQRTMQSYQDQGLTTQQFYRVLQEWIGDKRLVEKSITYSLDVRILERAELFFQAPLYLHLSRHPYGMISSFERMRMDQIVFRYPHPFSRRELAELIWLASHQNILQFLEHIPPNRQLHIRFEDLVVSPRSSVEAICRFLGLEFDPEMLQPYKEKERRMTDGLHSMSRMIGDPLFHEHRTIDARLADSWKRDDDEDRDPLGDLSWRMAETLGYERLDGRGRGAQESGAQESGVPENGAHANAAQLLAQLDQLSDEQVAALLDNRLAGRVK